jgi:hypothetical protein
MSEQKIRTPFDMFDEIANLMKAEKRAVGEIAPRGIQASLVEVLDRAISDGKVVRVDVYRRTNPYTESHSFLGCIENVNPLLLRGGGLEECVRIFSGGGDYRVDVFLEGWGRTSVPVALEEPVLPPLGVRMEHARQACQRRIAVEKAQDHERVRKWEFMKGKPDCKGDRWTWDEVLEVYELRNERAFLKEYGLLGALAIVVARYRYDTAQDRHAKTWDGLRQFLEPEDRAIFDRWLPPIMAEAHLHLRAWVETAYGDEYRHVYGGVPRRLPSFSSESRDRT